MSLNYTKQAIHALSKAQVAAQELNHYYVGTEHLLIGLRQVYTGVASQILSQHEINVNEIEAVIAIVVCNHLEKENLPKELDYSPRMRALFKASEQEAYMCNSAKIGTEHMLLALLKEIDCAGYRVLQTMLGDLQELYGDAIEGIGMESKEYHDQDHGGEKMLQAFTKDLSQLAQEGRIDPVIGRDKEITRLMEVLVRRNKNNPCIIGEPGIGKTAIVEGLAVQIHEGNVPDFMAKKKILSLDLAAMMAGTKYRGEFEERVKILLRQGELDSNIIFFIDEIHTIIGTGKGEGSLDIANMLKPALSRGGIQVIGATTIAEYRSHIEQDTALERRLQPVPVEEPTAEQCLVILKGIKTRYEVHHKVIIDESLLGQIIELSKRYIPDRYLPDKAIDVLDEACAKVSLDSFKPSHEILELEKSYHEIIADMEKALIKQDFETAKELQKKQKSLREKLTKLNHKKEFSHRRQVREVTLGHVTQVIAQWTQIPVDKLQETEKAKLNRLEATLHKTVVAQEDAINAVSKAVKRGRVGLKDPKRPTGSFLFLGPTGVGKTQLSKTIAEVMYGSEDSLLRIDMSEYMESVSVSKMIGAPPGYIGHGDPSQLTDKVRTNPYSVILFDEIEKAHPDVFNIMLQILDDGHLTDSKGRKVDFKNTIIIMTSNVGARAIVEPKELGFITKDNTDLKHEKMKTLVMEEVKRQFRPEFINRIDDIVVFHKLEKEHMKEIVNLLVAQFVLRVKEQLNIVLKVRPSVKTLILDKGMDIKYGARPLKRSLQTHLEDELAQLLLEGDLVDGDVVMATTKGGKVVCSKQA